MKDGKQDFMKQAEITEESIRVLVNRFYRRVRDDEALKPVFEGVIGADDASWGPHLRTMYDFWSSVMLTSGRYHGNPMQKHKDIPAFDESLFDRWLELFALTARETHEAEAAEVFIEKSQRIASSLRLGLYYLSKVP